MTQIDGREVVGRALRGQKQGRTTYPKRRRICWHGGRGVSDTERRDGSKVEKALGNAGYAETGLWSILTRLGRWWLLCRVKELVERGLEALGESRHEYPSDDWALDWLGALLVG